MPFEHDKLGAPAEPTADELAAYLREGRRLIQDEFVRHPHMRGRLLCQRLADLNDEVLRWMFRAACTEVGLSEHGVAPFGARMAVLATGGYGRRELAPFSDVDVTLAVSEEGDPHMDAVARRIFMLIMEVFTERLQLKVGYAYRLMEECPGLDHQTQTALLDARCVAGSADFAQLFAEELVRCLEPGVFVCHKLEERRQAWARFGGSVFVTEPNLKEGVGGLRDLHAAMWAARARYRIVSEDPLSYLYQAGILSEDEVRRVSEAVDFILSVRQALHFRSQRQSDVLTADKQDDVGTDLGFGPPPDMLSPDEPPVARRLMLAYYHHAEALHRISRRVLELCAQGPLPLLCGLILRDGRIHASETADSAFSTAEVVTEVVRYVQEYALEPAPELLASLRHQCDDAVKRAFPQLLTSVLSASRGVAKGVRLLLELGIMDGCLPEFARLMYTSPLSLAHRYTVGEHTLRVVELLEKMRSNSEGPDPACRTVFDSISRPEVLFLAALLHDAGKVELGRSHSLTGAEIAKQVVQRLDLDPLAAEQVVFLVRNHLLMSDTIRLRDLHQEQTIRDFVAVVHSPELLNMLFLLTCADMEATGTGVWTAVQSQFLDDLYYRAEAVLAGRVPKQDVEAAVEGYRNRVREELSLHNLPTSDVEQHCALMPATYLLNTPATEIAAHIRMVQRALSTGEPVVRFSGERGRGFTVLTVCTREEPKPGLLSKIAGVLYAHDVAVHAAQVFTRSALKGEGAEAGIPSFALDTLLVDAHGRELSTIQRIEVERDLVTVLSGRDTVTNLLTRKGRRLGEGSEVMNIAARNDLSDAHTVIEIRTSDQRGLLYRITRAIAAQGWHIHSARINTVGAEARDAFYVTDQQGRKVTVDTKELAAVIRRPIPD
ncbi:MAG: HD domain-containing protein [Armatimonadota bacterium]